VDRHDGHLRHLLTRRVPAAPRALPDIAEVDRISAISDPIVRNLCITQCYHEFSLVLAERTGMVSNWCTFATWASRQAGKSIRREDLADAFEALLARDPTLANAIRTIAQGARGLGAGLDIPESRARVHRALDLPAILDQTAAAVARGNHKVFDEIGRAFAGFIAQCLPDTAFDSSSLERFSQTLRPGDPPDGQRYLKQAFARYYRALFESDADARAELLLLANLEIGLHEQTRLQPEIGDAMDVTVPGTDVITSRLIEMLFPGRSRLIRLRLVWKRLLSGPTPLELAVSVVEARMRSQVRAVVTEHLMVLELAGGVRLQLGDDLRATFPEKLAHLANEELLHLLKQIDPTPDSLQATGAEDWSHLADRLHFIADLFRCQHENAALLAPPFTPEQLVEIRAGRIPIGRL
jgi:hypothetical protein